MSPRDALERIQQAVREGEAWCLRLEDAPRRAFPGALSWCARCRNELDAPGGPAEVLMSLARGEGPDAVEARDALERYLHTRDLTRSAAATRWMELRTSRWQLPAVFCAALCVLASAVRFEAFDGLLPGSVLEYVVTARSLIHGESVPVPPVAVKLPPLGVRGEWQSAYVLELRPVVDWDALRAWKAQNPRSDPRFGVSVKVPRWKGEPLSDTDCTLEPSGWRTHDVTAGQLLRAKGLVCHVPLPAGYEGPLPLSVALVEGAQARVLGEANLDFLVDRRPPLLEVTPRGAWWRPGRFAPVTVTAEERGSGLAGRPVLFEGDGAVDRFGDLCTCKRPDACEVGPWTCRLPLPRAGTPGTRFRFEVSDRAGNLRRLAVPLQVDGEPPRLGVPSPAVTCARGEPCIVLVEAADWESGLQELVLALDGVEQTYPLVPARQHEWVQKAQRALQTNRLLLTPGAAGGRTFPVRRALQEDDVSDEYPWSRYACLPRDTWAVVLPAEWLTPRQGQARSLRVTATDDAGNAASTVLDFRVPDRASALTGGEKAPAPPWQRELLDVGPLARWNDSPMRLGKILKLAGAPCAFEQHPPKEDGPVLRADQCAVCGARVHPLTWKYSVQRLDGTGSRFVESRESGHDGVAWRFGREDTAVFTFTVETLTPPASWCAHPGPLEAPAPRFTVDGEPLRCELKSEERTTLAAFHGSRCSEWKSLSALAETPTVHAETWSCAVQWPRALGTLVAESRDGFGRSSRLQVSLGVDDVAPRVTVNPDDGSFRGREAFLLDGTFTDEGVRTGEVFVSFHAGPNVRPIRRRAHASEGHWWVVTAVEDVLVNAAKGTSVKFSVSAQDEAGNEGGAVPGEVTVGP